MTRLRSPREALWPRRLRPSNDFEKARNLAARLCAGQVLINNPPRNSLAPFGDYKQSGNGRERGEYGIDEYLETKAIVGYGSDDA